MYFTLRWPVALMRVWGIKPNFPICKTVLVDIQVITGFSYNDSLHIVG